MRRLLAVLVVLLSVPAFALAAPHARVRTDGIRAIALHIVGGHGHTFIVQRVSLSPHRVVRKRVTRRNIVLRNLRPNTMYRIRVRTPGHAWGKVIRTRTRNPRVATAKTLPPMGAMPEIGFSDYADAFNNPAEFWSDVHALGGDTVRVIVQWSKFQPHEGEPNFDTTSWRQFHDFMKTAANEDLQVSVAFNSTPTWARHYSSTANMGGEPTDEAWKNWIKLFTSMYPSVHQYEWNEPNCCSMNSFIPTKSLAHMLHIAYPIMHAANSDVDVLAGSWCECGSGGVNQRDAIIDMAKYAKPGIDFDSFGFHFYPSLYGRAHGYDMPTPSYKGGGNYGMSDFPTVIGMLDKYFPGKHLRFHITETGWMTPGGYHGDALNEQCQSSAALWELSQVRRYTPRIASVIWFKIRDVAPSRITHNIYLSGMRYNNGTKKQSYSDWQNYIGNPPATYAINCKPNKE